MSPRLCDSEDCKTCTYIRDLKENDTVAACLASRPYMIDKEHPISYPLGDNSAAWQKFCREELQVPTNVYQTHATAIAANNNSHKTHFDNMARYKEFSNTFVVSCDAPLSTRVNDSKSCSYSFSEMRVRPLLLIGSLNGGGADL